MEREEEIRKRAEYIANGIMIDVQANKYHTNVYNPDKVCYNHSHLMCAVIEGAEWADIHPRKGLVDIEKVCEWLEEHLLDYWQKASTDTEEFIGDLKKAMKVDAKAVEPKFKVGDKVRLKGSCGCFTVKQIIGDKYHIEGKNVVPSLLSINRQDGWELIEEGD